MLTGPQELTYLAIWTRAEAQEPRLLLTYTSVSLAGEAAWFSPDPGTGWPTVTVIRPCNIRGAPDNHKPHMNPETGEAWKEIRFMFRRATKRAGLPEGHWFHDLRRSFVTYARRRGIAESVVMRLSGHKTRAVFDRYNVVDEGDVRAAVATIQAASIRERGGVGQEMVKVPEDAEGRK